jgi:hypothetical protein
MSESGQSCQIDRPTTLAACPLRPESDRRRSKCDPPLCANRDRTQRSKIHCYSITSLLSARLLTLELGRSRRGESQKQVGWGQ